jgi:hypothetical protein
MAKMNTFLRHLQIIFYYIYPVSLADKSLRSLPLAHGKHDAEKLVEDFGSLTYYVRLGCRLARAA